MGKKDMLVASLGIACFGRNTFSTWARCRKPFGAPESNQTVTKGTYFLDLVPRRDCIAEIVVPRVPISRVVHADKRFCDGRD